MGEASEISRAVSAMAALDVRRRLATPALTRATASTANEPILVPAQIADALGHLLVIYLIAVEVAAAA